MNIVYIRDERGNILKTYSREGVYVTDVSVEDNLVTLMRVVRQEDGNYAATADDQIVNNLVEDSGYNSSEVVATQTYERSSSSSSKTGWRQISRKTQNRSRCCLRAPGSLRSKSQIR